MSSDGDWSAALLVVEEVNGMATCSTGPEVLLQSVIEPPRVWWTA